VLIKIDYRGRTAEVLIDDEVIDSLQATHINPAVMVAAAFKARVMELLRKTEVESVDGQ